jgi:hypothetical protein
MEALKVFWVNKWQSRFVHAAAFLAAVGIVIKASPRILALGFVAWMDERDAQNTAHALGGERHKGKTQQWYEGYHWGFLDAKADPGEIKDCI